MGRRLAARLYHTDTLTHEAVPTIQISISAKISQWSQVVLGPKDSAAILYTVLHSFLYGLLLILNTVFVVYSSNNHIYCNKNVIVDVEMYTMVHVEAVVHVVSSLQWHFV